MRVVGLMSGTSHDAIDAAAVDVDLDGDVVRLGLRGLLSRPYPDAVHDDLRSALPPASTDLATVCRLDTEIGQAFADVAHAAIEELFDGQADLVVSHGQTVYHWVDGARVLGTLQLGSPAWIAERTGLPVVSDLRSRDVAAGGQGAPLVALFDLLWLADRPGRPVALNLGGIANATVPGEVPLAFDSGPANALIDAAVEHVTDGAEHIDTDGVRAARGSVDDVLLGRLLGDPYFAQPPPKTTGKELFHAGYLAAARQGRAVDGDDLVATATAATARSVADALEPYAPTEVIASGGGTHNPTLMRHLADALGASRLVTSEDLGLPSAAKEACAFALLGFLTVHDLAGTVASCTGASAARALGSITPGRRRLRLPTTAPTAPRRLRLTTWSDVGGDGR